MSLPGEVLSMGEYFSCFGEKRRLSSPERESEKRLKWTMQRKGDGLMIGFERNKSKSGMQKGGYK